MMTTWFTDWRLPVAVVVEFPFAVAVPCHIEQPVNAPATQAIKAS
jgi:hypothetical protein